MKKKLFWTIGIIIVALIVVAAWINDTGSSLVNREFDAQVSDVRSNPVFARSASDQSFYARSASGCSVFTVAKGDRIYFGGNDDYINPDSYYWVDPSGASRLSSLERPGLGQRRNDHTFVAEAVVVDSSELCRPDRMISCRLMGLIK